ncbi:MAG: DJ-1/PfpI family protein [Nakamurella sp.]
MTHLQQTRTALVALTDGHADWEVGHLTTELRTGRFTGVPFRVQTVALTVDPIITMGGIRILPDLAVEQLDPADSDLLILPGSTAWEHEGDPSVPAFLSAARAFVVAGVPVAAICGATFGLAAAGLLDDRPHTSADRDALAATGYAGGAHYVEARAVVGGGIITAGPCSPVQFSRAVLEHLGLMAPEIGEAYEGVFHREDADSYPVLMGAHT